MPARRKDADSRRFLDEFAKVRISRLRATGVVDPKKNYALIPFGDKIKLLNTAHTHLKYGGGYSFFICPKCNKLTNVIYLIDDAPLCKHCCHKRNILYRANYGFGRAARIEARQRSLDAILAKLNTTAPLRVKTPPETQGWHGRAQFVYNSRRLTARARRNMVALRLSQLARLYDTGKKIDLTAAAKQIVNAPAIWRARTIESLEQALDQAQTAIMAALKADDPAMRLTAAKLMLQTRQGRQIVAGDGTVDISTNYSASDKPEILGLSEAGCADPETQPDSSVASTNPSP